MKEWLDKCDKLEKLNFNSKIKIKDGLKGASKGYFPISMEKLKEENRQIYDSSKYNRTRRVNYFYILTILHINLLHL